MAGKIVADQIQGTTTTETVDGSSVTIPNVIDTKYVVNGSAKHWTNVNQTPSTPSLEDSFNNSSLTDGGEGDISPVFVSNMSSANYAAGLCCGHSGARFHGDLVNRASMSTSTYRTYWVNTTTAAVNDNDVATTTVHGDLA